MNDPDQSESGDSPEPRDSRRPILDRAVALAAELDGLTGRRGDFDGLDRETAMRSLGPLAGAIRRLLDALPETAAPPEACPVTGLPGRLAAAREIDQRAASGSVVLTAVAIERAHALAERYGGPVFEYLVGEFAESITSRITAGGKAFVWEFPVFAVVHSGEALAAARRMAADLTRASSMRTFEAGGRTVMLRIAAACEVSLLSTGEAAGEADRRMATFAERWGLGA